ncbi:MAG: cytochrome c [bacterium]|nr:cytochrome c [bacterium]
MINELSIITKILTIAFSLVVILIFAALVVPEKYLAERLLPGGCATITTDSYLPTHPPILKDLEGYKLYSRNCSPCHGVYNKIIGPALGQVAGRRDSLWITQWIQDNELLRSKDQIAQELYLEYNETQCLKNDFSKTDMSDLMTFLYEQNKVSK